MAEDRGPQLAAVNGLFIGLAWLFVLLRVYVKVAISKNWQADDYYIIVALIFFTTYASSSLAGVSHGTGQHVTALNVSSVPVALYYWWLCELFYTLSTVFVRLSIAVTLLRIAVKPIHRNVIYGTLAMVIAYSTAYFFLVIFQCHPVSYFWGQYEGAKGHCIDPSVVPSASIAHSVVSFTADWILGLLPIAIIWQLQMNIQTKISVAGVLSLGLLAGIATMIRVPYIKTLALTDDFLFATTDVVIWSTVEPALGIIACGAITLRPLFKNFYALTTRNKSSAHRFTATNGNSKHSKLRNSHRGSAFTAARTQELKSVGGSDQEMGLSTEMTHTDRPIGLGKGGATVTSSPFSDQNEVKGSESKGNGVGWGEIHIHRTVEITRGDEESLSSAGTEPHTPWPRSSTRRFD